MNNPFRRPLDDNRQSAMTTPLRIILATTAAFWMGTVQPQVISPATARSVTELRFRQFFTTPIGPAGLEVSDTLRHADGQVVRLTGYMVQQENATPGRFLLTPRPVQMSEHADGEADDLPPATVVIHLDPSQQDWIVPHVRGLVTVSGVLSVKRQEAADGRISWVSLQLAEEAARSMNMAELIGYLHSRQQSH